MPLKPLHSLASLSVVVLGAALLAPLQVPAPAAAGGARHSLPQALHEKLSEPLLRYDRPDEALELYRMKRAPVGQKVIPVERYLKALDQMRTMPQHSTARQALLPSREELKSQGTSSVAEDSSLGAWTPLGPGNIGGRTRVLLIDPRNPHTMYAAAAAGGVWKSTDGAVTWKPLSDLTPNLAVNSLAMDPANSNVLYAGTGEGYFNIDSVRGAGIFKTTDGGATWTQLAATAGFYYVNDVKVSSRNSNRVYASTDSGIFRSLDRGATWSQVYKTTVFGGCLDLALRTDTATDSLFAACGTFEQSAVLRNTAAEGNGAWNVVLTEKGMGRTTLAIAPSNQNVVYALSASVEPGNYQDGLYGVFRSSNGGAAGSWTATVRNTSKTKLNTLLLTNPVIAYLKECGFSDGDIFLNQGWYDNVIAVDPKDPNRVWAGGVDLFRSDDGGKSWGLASYWWATSPDGNAPSYAHADQHAIVFHPLYNGTTIKTMFVGNDGGIFKNVDARAQTTRTTAGVCDPTVPPISWQPLNNGYAVTQFYQGTPYPDGTAYLGGTQDNGTDRGKDATGPNQWEQILGGDGGFTAIDPQDTNTLYAENTGPSISKSTDGGGHWADATNGIDDNTFLFIVPFAMDPSNPQRLWLGGSSLWRTTDGAAHWSQASGPVGGTNNKIVSAVTVAPSNPNHVLAGTVEGFIMRGDDALTSTGSTRWRRNQPQRGYVTSIAIDPTDPNVSYATYSTFGTVHVWKSVNAGTNWTPLDGTGDGKLPDIPVNSIVIDPAHPANLYVGTDMGVFASTDGGQHWLIENTGFANVATEWLTIRTGPGGQRELYAFTHGRGAWRVELP
jgi:photosystem II stability/assembly factor-like uncharacterized protein